MHCKMHGFPSCMALKKWVFLAFSYFELAVTHFILISFKIQWLHSICWFRKCWKWHQTRNFRIPPTKNINVKGNENIVFSVYSINLQWQDNRTGKSWCREIFTFIKSFFLVEIYETYMQYILVRKNVFQFIFVSYCLKEVKQELNGAIDGGLYLL